VTVSLKVLYQCRTVETLARFLEGNKAPVDEPAEPAEAAIDWAQEPARYYGELPPCPPFASEQPSDPQRQDVLLTGYLGAFLLFEILRRYPATTKVYCLVRTTAGTSALERLQQHLDDLQIAPYPGDWDRIVLIDGDLGPRLGLAAELYDRLAVDIATIYHAAAQVNSVLPASRQCRGSGASCWKSEGLSFHEPISRL
jgi:hypothetical protein